MAGAGYKLFNTGDVLTAAQVNTYLQEQAVMRFANASARTTALSGVLAEGMVSYLDDTNTLEVYNGSAWVSAIGDITEVQAGTGISVTSGTGPIPTIAIDTAVVPRLGNANTFTSTQLVSVNSASNALEIRQLGAGNALLVEDETNPDSTPFVIAADGRVAIGATTPSAQLYLYNATSAGMTAEGDAGTNNTIARSSTDITGPNYILRKARGTTASKTTITSGDSLGTIQYQGFDGTTNLVGASIQSNADATVSTGVIPGRLTFLTANTSGANSERMRINSSGNVGIGGSGSDLSRLLLAGTLTTSSNNSQTIRLTSTIPSTTTNGYWSVISAPITQAASFTLTNLYHFSVEPQTFGAGSAVTNQFGFIVNTTLTGATNNYGFYSDITAATGRWNFVANGTAANFFAGRVGIGASLTSGAMAQVVNTTAADVGFIVKGAAAQSGDLENWQNSAGTVLVKIDSSGNLVTGNMAIATSSVATIHISNGTIPSANPVGGGVLYVESGALKYRGSSGTITTIANA